MMINLPSSTSSPNKSSPPPPNLMENYSFCAGDSMLGNTMPVLEREASPPPLSMFGMREDDDERSTSVLHSHLPVTSHLKTSGFLSHVHSAMQRVPVKEIIMRETSSLKEGPSLSQPADGSPSVGVWLPRLLQAWMEPLTFTEAVKMQWVTDPTTSSSGSSTTSSSTAPEVVYTRTLLRFEATLRRTLRVLRAVPHFKLLASSTRARLMRESLTFGGVDLSNIMQYDATSRCLRVSYFDINGRLQKSPFHIKNYFPKGLQMRIASSLMSSANNSRDFFTLLAALTDMEHFDQMYTHVFHQIVSSVNHDQHLLVALWCLRFFHVNLHGPLGGVRSSCTGTPSASSVESTSVVGEDQVVLNLVCKELTEYVREYATTMWAAVEPQMASNRVHERLDTMWHMFELVKMLEHLGNMFMEFSVPPPNFQMPIHAHSTK